MADSASSLEAMSAQSDTDLASFQKRYLSGYYATEGGKGYWCQDYIEQTLDAIYSDADPNEPPQRRNIRGLLSSITVLMHQFYLDDLLPFSQVDTGPGEMSKPVSESTFTRSWRIQKPYTEIQFLICRYQDDIADHMTQHPLFHPLWKRHDAGILREEQVKVVSIIAKEYVQQMRELIRDDELKDEEKAMGRHMLFWLSQDCSRLYTKLICCPDLRSERVELLILKYLEEPGVNMDVVRAIMEIGVSKYLEDAANVGPVYLSL
ncbi:hypothetical protein BJ508DRAFT_332861 [Ascobolus immersus RN42]|uniref:Uncharacterized protein n=1 Tax=Ascobolus immersus RN42 TaxID=1160509 RepID=A0A3N4HMZ9_ASCIM|nr:hypothetical protein BJ508DRAFT_332861 [Ascobolus immersus RN42]